MSALKGKYNVRKIETPLPCTTSVGLKSRETQTRKKAKDSAFQFIDLKYELSDMFPAATLLMLLYLTHWKSSLQLYNKIGSLFITTTNLL